MIQSIPNLIVALPEIFLLVMICVALIADLFVPQKKKTLTFVITQAALVGAGLLTIVLYSYPDSYTFFDMFVHDRVASLLKVLICLISFFAFLYTRHYIQSRHIPEGEYYILGLVSVLGMMVLVSANNLLVLFLGLEILSMPLYAMTALQRDLAPAAEAAMKYYITGAMASALLLYGLSLIYGTANSLNIMVIAHAVPSMGHGYEAVLALGLVFVVAGIAFKIGAAPFHMWAPDVYQGAPAPVTLFIGSAPKIAAVGMAIRLLIDGMPELSVQWQQLLIIVALLSMAWGNIVAIVQTDIKRMLAYSSIAHMGYMSLGLIAATPDGYAAAIFYIIIYAIMVVGAFAVIVFMSKSYEAERIEDYRGLNSRNPWLAFMMLLLMFSMAGIPPSAGFFAKLGVLQALVTAHLVWLAVVALIFAVIGAYYYLAIVKVMYFEEPYDPAPITTSRGRYIALTINSLAVLVLGLFPTTLINLCRGAF